MDTKKINKTDFTQMLDLAAESLGGKVIYATDDFFAEKENLIKPGRGVFIADKYTDRGKWMDGWESRRKRTPGHDWCVIALATPGTLRGFDIDTNHFLGNHPSFASVEGILTDSIPHYSKMLENLDWEELLPKSPLDSGSQNIFKCDSDEVFSHLRLNIYPDGGVARFRAYGDVYKDWKKVKSDEELDLAAAINGGEAILCNDMFFSSMENLIMPGRGRNMGDGWETKRNRNPDNVDWVILKLAQTGKINRILVDTHHFKGNYPDRCSLEACFCENNEEVLKDKVNWIPILPEQKLFPDTEHHFKNEIKSHSKINFVRFKIFPDGGVSRLRLFGNIAR